MTMTRAELIRRIEAGEDGTEVLRQIANIVGWDKIDGGGPPLWLSSLDAAVTLVRDGRWFVDDEGWAAVDLRGKGVACHVSRNPAAALVAAWLKATA